jgi:shikimate kinase
MTIQVYEAEIPLHEIIEVSKEYYHPMIKGVIDIENEIVAFGGEYHMDANVVLLEKGLQQSNIWGFNIWTDQDKENWIEYTSLINIRPLVNNKGMEIESQEIKNRIKEILDKKII